MKYNFKQIIKKIDGQPFVLNQTPLTFKKACQNALFASYNDEQDLSGEDKYTRYKVSIKLEADVPDLTIEEISLIKKVVGKGYSPEILGPIYIFLDNPVTIVKENKNEQTETT